MRCAWLQPPSLEKRGWPLEGNNVKNDSNRALIIGGGRGGCAMLEMLLEEQLIHVVGVVDVVSDAPGMELARVAGISTFADLDEALKACQPCMAFNLTGNMLVNEELLSKNHVGGVVGGVEALMMWRMVTRMQEMKNVLYHQAHHDQLTEVYNRRYMIERLNQGIAESVRYDMPYSAALIDLDHFKSVNDTHGHAAGDAVLKSVVSAIQTCLRQSDILGRWGGEEFLVLLPHIDGEHAVMAAHKWLKHVSASPVDMGDGQSKVITFSSGVATFDKAWMEKGQGKALDTFMECIDNRLYRAKDAGRNRIVGADIS